MSRSVLYMSMSVDGYIAGPNDRPGNPGGDQFMRLHEWYGFASEPGPTEELADTSGMGAAFLNEARQRERSSPDAIPWSRPATGVVTTTVASRSSSLVTVRRIRRRRHIPW